MGGRGAKSGIKKQLPNYRNAVIHRNKLKNYLLSPEKSNGKADFFNAIGYNMRNYKTLERDIRIGLKSNTAVAFNTDKYGNVSYEVIMEIGISKKEKVKTGWRVDNGTKIPRLITAYPAKGGKNSV